MTWATHATCDCGATAVLRWTPHSVVNVEKVRPSGFVIKDGKVRDGQGAGAWRALARNTSTVAV